MGQYWQLINLEKRRTLGHWGKIMEIVWNRPRDTLIPYLTIPATPLDPAAVKEVDLIGPWADDRLVCVGDYVRTSCYHKRMLTREELAEASETDLYSVAYESYTEAPCPKLPRDPVAFARGKVWVLRNLSKLVYVRVDAFESAPEHIAVPRSRADVR
ncbi:hypothetical protein LshimejAT787_1801350 [Lyophyllum shimeji]|uniref:Uncharacterized protein n=1 Tax=Lyophyllum shimeji TaxID=47721 RepID=A0A9P3UTN8_LYOSH|nr:hypothetical protein LshimejAT787_1801350 [Lyophyllum shimeji]